MSGATNFCKDNSQLSCTLLPASLTGQAWLPELGLYYYKARMYSPTLGRFLQTDPIGYSGGMNLHAYVGSDPVNRVADEPAGVVGSIPSRRCGRSR